MILIVQILFSIAITCLTYYLNVQRKWGPIKASAVIATIFGGVHQLWGNYLHDSIPFIAIGSTFIGMVSVNKYNRKFNFVLAPLLFVIIYHNMSSNFDGFGGALGTAACCSLIISIYLRSLKATKRIISPFRKLKIHTARRLRNIK